MKEQKSSKNLTGIIKTDNGNIVFFAEDFKFTFMKADFSIEKIVLNADESGYIWGTTHGGKTIAIYSREDVEIKNIRILNTWNYIISKHNGILKDYMQSFKGIRFKSGGIKTIYPCDALHEDFEKTKENIITYHIKPDHKDFQFQQEGESVIWSFSSVVHQNMSIDEGDSLSNSDSLLDIIFDKEQTYNTFYNYYGYVCDLCAFLTFRNNISFEKVYLLCESPYNSREEYAECYIRKPNTVSQRNFLNIIHIRWANDMVFSNILLNILKIDKKHKGLPLFIIPEDDMDAKKMDVGKIRSICSALEMELDMEGVRLQSGTEIKELIKSVKQLIKEHRKKNSELSEKTYDNIFGSISHWDQPLAERAWEAWKQHKDDLKPFINNYDISITQDRIQEFVKARNNITHNGFTGIDEKVCITAFALMGLIYCCTLTRLGMKSEEIKYIMKRKIIG